MFVCRKGVCGWSGNADRNVAWNVLRLYRTEHAPILAAERQSPVADETSSPQLQCRRDVLTSTG